MSSQQNITLVKKLFEDIYSKNNIAALNQYFTSDVRLIDAAAPNFRGGLTGLTERETMYKNAFPNRAARIDDIFASEDQVVVSWSMQATQSGALQDIPATNKKVKVSGISIYHFIDGKISEINQNWDRLGLLEQIGAVEPSVALHR